MKIIETLVTTSNADGSGHVAPFGIHGLVANRQEMMLAPFRPSRSLENLLRADATAVIHLSDDPLLFVRCITGRRDFIFEPAEQVDGWVLPTAVKAIEVRVRKIKDDPVRPHIYCQSVHCRVLNDWSGYNRAGMAIIEGCILMSRLSFLDKTYIASSMALLADIVARSSGALEEKAWSWLQMYYQKWQDEHDDS